MLTAVDLLVILALLKTHPRCPPHVLQAVQEAREALLEPLPPDDESEAQP